MLSEPEVFALVDGRHDDPFAVLGLHRDGEGAMWARAMLPQAREVALHEAQSGLRVAKLGLRHPQGLWEACVPRLRHRFDYRLRVLWSNGAQGRYADAYAFDVVLPAHALEQIGCGEHPRPAALLGAHCMEIGGVAGVRFAIRAPGATHASVIGDFNGWDMRRHPMRYRHPWSVWEIFVPHAAAGDLYKFSLTGPDGRRRPDLADPHERASEGGPGAASRVAAPGSGSGRLPATEAPSHNEAVSDRQERLR
jgi:1,4-alpha-glucan branching enzyme